jgi:hypothetical protein
MENALVQAQQAAKSTSSKKAPPVKSSPSPTASPTASP